MSKNQVVKSNQVIEASYQLSTIEQRLVLSAICKIPKSQAITDNELYCVSVEELQVLGTHEKTAYRDLKEGVNRLYERSINVLIGSKSIKMRLVQEIQFMDSKGIIGIRFSKPILPFISNLSREFTKYALSDIAGMNSAYSIRIYELLVQYKTIGRREISLDELRNMLELGNRYPLFADFKKRVIDTAINQINNNSPLKASYEQRKTGRKVTHLIFTFSEKKPETEKPKRTPKVKEKPILGVPMSEIEQRARAGETYEQAAARINREKDEAKAVKKQPKTTATSTKPEAKARFAALKTAINEK